MQDHAFFASFLHCTLYRERERETVPWSSMVKGRSLHNLAHSTPGGTVSSPGWDLLCIDELLRDDIKQWSTHP